MQNLITHLHQGNFSCVIHKGGEVREFSRRGVIDLYELLVHDAAFLRDSELADKVIGKGAAVLMIKGGVMRVYADVISAPALELLRTNGVDVTFQTQVANIKNRAGTDMCPVEKRCLLLTDLDEMVGAIRSFLEQQQLI